MGPVENLYYAIGQAAFAMAMADGRIQKEERQRLCELVTERLNGDYRANVGSIIFQVLDKEHASPGSAFDSAIRHLKLYSHYLSPGLKQEFHRVMLEVAKAYPPVTIEEKSLLDQFLCELNSLKGDPDFYEAV